MDRKEAENYQVEDFATDQSFINYHFQLDINDQLFWETWLNEHPGNSMLAAEAEKMLEILSLRLPDHEFQQELAKIKKAIDYKNPAFKPKEPALVRFLDPVGIQRLGKVRKKAWLGFLLPVLLIFLAGGYFLYQHFTLPVSQLGVKFNHSGVPVVFTLSDSTVVTLAPQSVLRYPVRFADKEREVYLEGEAQFHVKRDVAHPFKVYAGELAATVLGTVFKIKQQQGDSMIQVELLTGKLKVETINNGGTAPAQSIVLAPEERVLYNRHAQTLIKETWQPNAEHAATTSHLQFRKDNFEAIAKQLKAVFGITVVNESSKKNWLFTGEFNNSTAKEIVEYICIIKKLNYQVQGDTIFIK